MASVAVIIPTRNMADTLWVALGSACRAGADEIVVIDDASEDHTPDVVRLWKSRNGRIQYVRHDEKIHDHQYAQVPIYNSIASNHVINLSADDWLYPWAIEEVRARADQAVIFTSVDAFDDGVLYTRTDRLVMPEFATADQVRLAVSSRPISESGMGASLRSDVARWLCDLDVQSLGPCWDSVGYTTVAAIHGAAYVPRRCAALAERERSYGRNPDWTEDFFTDLARKSVKFMTNAGLDVETMKSICLQKCRVNPTWI